MRNPLRTLVAFTAVSFVALAATLSPAAAQAWPDRPVKFIIPLGPGAGVDITARLVADKLSTKWGQPVVVENRPGGDAFVAITGVLSANDTHTLLFAPASTFTAHPLLHDKLPYNPKDLTPIARVTNTLIALGVPTEIGVGTVKELAAKIKEQPNKLNYASVTGANDLSENRIQAFVGAYAIMRPRVQAGKVKVIALTNTQHAQALNDIPTAAEAGFRSLELDGLVGLLGPKDMPLAMREKIAADIKQVLSDPEINAKLAATGQVVNPGSPKEFEAALNEQSGKVVEIGKILGIKAAGN